MPLFDRVKSQAQQVAQSAAQKAQEAGQAGKAKFDELQAKRQIDSLQHDLGALVYADRVGRGSPNDAGEIDRIVEQIRSLEAELSSSSGDS